MAQASVVPAHATFPLTRQALDSLSLTPEFDYPDPYCARQLNNRLKPPLPVYTPGEISAVGLIGKIYLRVIDLYLTDAYPDAFHDLDKLLISNPANIDANTAIKLILEHFPTSSSHFSPVDMTEYLLSFPGPFKKRHGFYKSLLLIFLADSNLAIRKKDNLFTDPELRKSLLFSAIQTQMFDHLSEKTSFAPDGKSLVDFLIEPSKLHPDSLFEQLEYIRQHWSPILGDEFLTSLLKALDQIKEEKSRASIVNAFPQDPLGDSLASYQTEQDSVNFSADLAWMPNVILLAKNIYVWLDQLSKEYQASIFHLDHIPDQELEKISDWGITGLWLIGLWQRSSASQKIKQICGNLDAVPSAYSLFDYSIADSLGGEEAYQNLSHRAAQYNIRLAADMVPNHMGIYSKWIIEHPDWFLSVDKPPFPGYSFNGTDLSDNKKIGIYLEDHYYDKTDAAVVFKRVDRYTGSDNYIYHGNDGTSMPWNDTAQLDFLNPEVREAVIQQILHVARKFPIIRFDAAMTLAKKHIQRLWYPEPGSGGAIPTRSEFGLSEDDFDVIMPEEFWREVVDRVAVEAPDTLLLAEAFWMMEGYFVRSLGMHRVYNSAFMHMLRDEENAKFRDLIIKTLSYDPQILKRYVNYMNNPDEDTAISQYGSGGKYFGVCVLMATLPGLPMIGHGQIEGFSEKYGMEYQRAYYNEEPNYELIKRHQLEIFPLLHKRFIFAEVENFFFFDFTDGDGFTNQNVFAYTNRFGSDSALVVYHNKWGDVHGIIQNSVPINGSSTRLIDSLGCTTTDGDYVLFRDQISGLEYIRPLSEFSSHGLSLNLGAYDYRVFMDFSIIQDHDAVYSRLYDSLNGVGVQSLHDALIDQNFAALSEKLDAILTAWFSLTADKDSSIPELDTELLPLLSDLVPLISALTTNNKSVFHNYQKSALARLHRFDENFQTIFPGDFLALRLSSVLWLLLYEVYNLSLIQDYEYLPRSLAKQPFLNSVLSDGIHLDFHNHLKVIKSLTPMLVESDLGFESIVNIWFNHGTTDSFLGLSKYNDIAWFNKESFGTLLDLTIIYILFTDSPVELINSKDDYLAQLAQFRSEVLDRMKKSNYQVNNFHSALLRSGKEWNSHTAKSRS